MENLIIRKSILAIILGSMFIGIAGCNPAPDQLNPATQTAISAGKTLVSYPFLSSSTANLPASTLEFHQESETPVMLGGTPTVEPVIPDGMIRYISKSGDTLPVIAAHFGVSTGEVLTFRSTSEQGLLPLGAILGIPYLPEDDVLTAEPALPDSEVIYGPGTSDFDLIAYATEAGGFLTRYTENIDGKDYTGPEIVQMVARDTSTNPRLLLAFLEYRSNWVLGDPFGAIDDKYPIGFGASDNGLYKELQITTKLLTQGYYGWRNGTLSEIIFFDSSIEKINPEQNAGSVAIQHLFGALYRPQYWYEYLYGSGGFLTFYHQTFGSPWARAELVEPLLNETVTQPELALPFLPGLRWSLTGGSHTAWQTGTPRGALDFAPVTGEAACAVSSAWATASASGEVVRSERGVVALDLDGDGNEGTGWVLIYLHIADKERVEKGARLSVDDKIGHPSCERGASTGTHVHFVRKYNGEWIPAEGALPLILDGWQAFAGKGYYEGTLVRGNEVIRSSASGMQGSSIFRD